MGCKDGEHTHDPDDACEHKPAPTKVPGNEGPPNERDERRGERSGPQPDHTA